MINPPIGKRKTSKHQRTLLTGGRLDFNTSTTDNVLAPSSSIISERERLTEDNDIKDENNETDDSTSSTKLPSIAMALSRDLVNNRGSHSKADKEELEKHAECGSEHLEVSRGGSAKIW
jgi:hypothetical protein